MTKAFDPASLLGSYASRTMLHIREVAAILRRQGDFVRALIDCGKLHAFGVPGREKQRKRVTTASVALYLVETADFNGAEYQKRLRELFSTWTPAQREWAVGELTRGGMAR